MWIAISLFYIADESGEYTVERFISIFTEHDLHHIRQIENHLAKNAVETQPDSSSAPLEQLDRLIGQHPRLHGALAGISICDAITGRTIYEHMAATRLHPASNMKLLTAAAALETLGENYVWKTEIWIDGEIVGDELCGSLYIKGKGDPTLQPSDLEQFTADLYHRFGIRKITGDIVADDTWYDNVRLSPDMMWLDEHCYYGAQVSALTLSPDNDYDAGTVKINVRPGLGDGSPVEVSLYPDTNYIHIENNAITVAEQTNDVGIEFLRKHGENTVIMNGAIPLTAEKESEWIAVWEPTAYVLSVWVDKLRQKGIHISGNAKVDAVPETGKLLMQHESIPLCELLIPFMKLSNNGHGEILVKEMGKVVRGEGSWDLGMEVVLENAASFGIDTDNILLRDGSGISHVNLIAPQQLTNLLFFIQKKPWFDTYYRSLPIAGKKRTDGGWDIT
ncbi:D-alanyl-D-alanine carboxypeptidase/D-alanyl-D-alanine-endopeptidase [Virgibacillus halophilus]|uniref:D-alanyl-D-alanine carboxypeptidase/D-alanyl-D-alanine-endopeptidase n=1 Tax=Tigheibacillus halophilus TaxID=361280 RepID=A0ABU5CC01_9BACI|nr:D-alanyl-D-alanine carboxypeptidase/D-alanyl-D-alanine-endopeptidase [Virgibacillus halophilus]